MRIIKSPKCSASSLCVGSSVVIRLVGLIKEKVGSELLILIARKVSLDDQVPFEAKAA